MRYTEDEYGNLIDENGCIVVELDEDGVVIDTKPSPVEIDPIETIDCSRAFHVMACDSHKTLKALALECGLREDGLYSRENIHLNKFIEIAAKAGYEVMLAKKVNGGYKATRMVRK